MKSFRGVWSEMLFHKLIEIISKVSAILLYKKLWIVNERR